MNETRAVVTDPGDGIVLSVYNGHHLALARLELSPVDALHLAEDLLRAAALRIADASASRTRSLRRWLLHPVGVSKMILKTVVKKNIKMCLAPLIYRHYPIGLQPPRLYFWLDALYKTRNLSGAVVEIGVAGGGTSAFSFNFLRQIASKREYIGIDTFGGFIEEQFAEDVKFGNNWKNFRLFAANSIDLVRKILKMHDAQEVKLLQGDISKIDQAKIPHSISACLLDVDLAVPIYDGLKLVWPLVENGGVIVVDDCYDDNKGDWQALVGYRKFCHEMSLAEHFFCGTGYLVKGNPVSDIGLGVDIKERGRLIPEAPAAPKCSQRCE